MSSLSLFLLGPFTATLGKEPPITFPARSVQALLAYLAVEAPSSPPLRREAVAELLWPGLDSASSRKNLRQSLYELRRLIPRIDGDGGTSVEFILADRETLTVNPAGKFWLDTTVLEELLAQGGVSQQEEAVTLYRGDFLADLYLPDSEAFEAWVSRQRAYYRRRVLEALSDLAGHYLVQGEFDRAETHARQQLKIDDLRESALRQLMQALVGSGQRNAALAEYEQARERLQQELGVEPAAETKALNAAIRAGQVAPPAADKPGLALGAGAQKEPEAPVPLHNLPAQTTTFVGRQEELAELCRCLQEKLDCRALTLLGPGGSGKTRLALEVASCLLQAEAPAFPDGIWLVPLALVDQSQAVLPALASTLDFSFYAEREPRQQLLDYLRQRRLLLLLDNFEHLIDADSVGLLSDILQAAPGVRLLVTSRARLNVRGERLFPVSGLTVPAEGAPLTPDQAEDHSAVQLFLQNARRVRPDFALTSENIAYVVAICRLLQGMPLGIELAASWSELLEPQAIAAELERSLDFLEAEWLDLPPRQRSLRAVFSASWQLLTEQEQSLLKQLCVFHGGFTWEAAQKMCGASLPLLLGLANKSWLMRDAGGRFYIHELLRHYAVEKARAVPEEWSTARTTHAHHYAAWLSEQTPRMQRAQQNDAFRAIATEFANVRRAAEWLLSHEEVQVFVDQILLGMALFCSARGRTKELLLSLREAQSRLENGAAGQTGPYAGPILAVAEVAFYPEYYYLRFLMDWFSVFELPLPQNIQRGWLGLHAAPPEEVASVWQVLAATFYGWSFDPSTAVARLEELAQAYRRRGDRWSLALALQNIGRILEHQDYVDRHTDLADQADTAVEDALREAATLFQEVGDELEMAHTLRLLGTVVARRDPAEALALAHRARDTFQQVGDRVAAAHMLWQIALIHLEHGEIDDGFKAFGQMRQAFEDLGNRKFTGYALSLESIERVRFGDVDVARRLRQRSLEIAREIDDKVEGIAYGLWELGEVERVAGNERDARHHFEEARRHFAELGHEAGFAFYHRGLGDLALDAGDYTRAWEHFQFSLAIAEAVDHPWMTAYAHCGLGRSAMHLGRYDEARQHFHEGLQLAQHGAFNPLALVILAGLASLYAQTGHPERALEIGVFVQSHPVCWWEVKNRLARVLAQARQVLPPDVSQDAESRGHRLRLAEAVTAALAQTQTP